MIDFSYQTDFQIQATDNISRWISDIITSEGRAEGEIGYVFCDDDFLIALNKEFLDHDTLTDIISFDYSLDKEVHGEIYISVERVHENATDLDIKFEDELHRVIVHGILHLCGFNDKTEEEIREMRKKENEALQRRKFL